MTAISYSILVGDKKTEGSIKNWTAKSNIPSAVLLEMAQQFIYRSLRVWQMLELDATGVMSIDANTVNQPTRYLWPETMRITGVDAADIEHQISADVMRAANFQSDGTRVKQKPQIFFERGAVLQFDAPADKAYPYEILYYKQPESLSGSIESNFLTERHSTLLISACQWAAYRWLENAQRRDNYAKETLAAIDLANQESDMAVMRGAHIETIVDPPPASGFNKRFRI